MELDSGGDLFRVGGAVTQGGLDLAAREDGLLGQRGDRVSFGGKVLDPHDDLPYVGPTDEPGPAAGGTIAKGDQRVFIPPNALLGIAAQPIREGLAGGPGSEAEALDESVFESDRDVLRHVCIVAQRMHVTFCSLRPGEHGAHLGP